VLGGCGEGTGISGDVQLITATARIKVTPIIAVILIFITMPPALIKYQPGYRIRQISKAYYTTNIQLENICFEFLINLQKSP
jgi:hypothetical protein